MTFTATLSPEPGNCARCTLASQAMMDRIEVVVVGRQRGDMHQALDINVLQLNEDAEASRRGNHTLEISPADPA